MSDIDEKIKEYQTKSSDCFDNSKFYMDKCKEDNNNYLAISATIELTKYRMFEELKCLAEIIKKEL